MFIAFIKKTCLRYILALVRVMKYTLCYCVHGQIAVAAYFLKLAFKIRGRQFPTYMIYYFGYYRVAMFLTSKNESMPQ